MSDQEDRQPLLQETLVELDDASSSSEFPEVPPMNPSDIHPPSYVEATIMSDEEDSDEAICRICYDKDPENELFQPCRCAGSMRLIHESCLNEWRATAENQEAFNKCMNCHYVYQTTNQASNPGILGKFNRYIARKNKVIKVKGLSIDL